MTDRQTVPISQAASRTRTKTLIFHIGDHKTGSTSIQYAFAQKQVQLKDRMVFYPAQLSHNPLRQHFLAYDDPKDPAAHDRAVATFAALADRIRDAKADFCLLSSEAIEGVDPAVFHKVLATHFSDVADDIRIVGYVRPHAARILSSFTERTKIGIPAVLKGSLESYFEQVRAERRFHYLPRFRQLRELFGDRFLLRPMIRSQLFQGSVVDDFIHHAFGQSEFTVIDGGRVNESLCLEDLMRLKILQSHMRGRKLGRVRSGIGWEFIRLAGQLPPPETRTRLRLHKALARKIREAYLEDARAMDQAFFAGEALLETELSTAVDTALDEPQSTDPADYFTESEMRSLMLMSRLATGFLENEGQEWLTFLRRRRFHEINRIARANSN